MGSKRASRVKHGFFHGAVILMSAMVIGKLLGLVFKVQLMRIIGEVGNGYYTMAYTLFTPIYTFTVIGLPATVARMIASYTAQGRFHDIRKLKVISTKLFRFLGLLSFLVIAGFAWVFTNVFMNTPPAFLSVLLIAPVALLGIMSAVYRGYFEGMRNMTPTAMSEIIEIVIKLIFSLGLAYLVYQMGVREFNLSGTLFGQAIESSERLEIQLAQYTTAAAIVGVAISTMGGLLFLWLTYRIKGDGITREELVNSPPAARTPFIFNKLIKYAIPISLGSLILNASSVIDLVTVYNRIEHALNVGYDRIMNSYGSYIPADIRVDELPNFFFGVYGMVLLLGSLIPDFVRMIGKSALINIAAVWAEGDKYNLKRKIEAVTRLTAFLAMPAGVGLFVLANPILSLLFPGMAGGVAIAAPVLEIFSVSVIFMSLVIPLFNVFQAIGRADLPLKFMALGASLKLICNFILVGIPQINLKGAPIGTILCYFIILILCFTAIRNIVKIKLDYIGTLIKPAVAAISCGFAAKLVLGAMENAALNRLIPILISVLTAVIIYAVSLIILRAISSDDIISLPKGEIISKTLAKYKIIRYNGKN
ncbi:MAG: polysaccharide biosynthesis C-terminal domain-containing protein [Oscillospiraceae bacterium]|nr:polysaccharide biosynthesis C-terminal domain-containing protein [Oscillospiraceae bacterium]